MPEITQLLRSIEGGNEAAQSELFAVVYAQLRSIAGSRMLSEPQEHTLQPTALVHEAYLRLFRESGERATPPRWDGSRHFYGAAANAMRQILIESARRRQTQKRGGDFTRVFVKPDGLGIPERANELLSLDESLSRLEKAHAELAELVRLRFYAGLTIPDVARELGIGKRTADEYWAYAKAWLLADMQDNAE